MQRAFGFDAMNAEGFDILAMLELSSRVAEKVEKLYAQDLNGKQKYIKSSADMEKYISLVKEKLNGISTGLNSSGRMLEFMKSFGIEAPMQEHSESTQIMYQDIKDRGRFYKYIAHKYIDTDGRVYHMDYARFFPTEIQLNLKNKEAAPKLANLREDCLITNEMINRAEARYTLDDVI